MHVIWSAFISCKALMVHPRIITGEDSKIRGFDDIHQVLTRMLQLCGLMAKIRN